MGGQRPRLAQSPTVVGLWATRILPISPKHHQIWNHPMPKNLRTPLWPYNHGRNLLSLLEGNLGLIRKFHGGWSSFSNRYGHFGLYIPLLLDKPIWRCLYLVAHLMNLEWVITPVIRGLSRLTLLTSEAISHLRSRKLMMIIILSGVSHQVQSTFSGAMCFPDLRVSVARTVTPAGIGDQQTLLLLVMLVMSEHLKDDTIQLQNQESRFFRST